MSVRFFSAMHVVMHHFLIMVPGFRASAPDWLKRLVAAAPAEVGLFFVMSGFVLAYNYLREDGSLLVTKREFLVARIARIYPIYLLGLLVYAPIAIARYFSGTGLSVGDISPAQTLLVGGILAVFLLQTWTVVFQGWNPPAWSVSAEAFFYSFFPYTGSWLARLSGRGLTLFLAVLWSVSLAIPGYFLIAILNHSSKDTKELWEVGMTTFPLFRIIPFLFGIAAAILFVHRRKVSEGKPYYPALLNIIIVVFLLLCALVPTNAERLLENILTPLFACSVYLIAFERGVLCRFLGHPFIVLLGQTSYALYILHNPLWNYMARLQNIYGIVFRGHFPVGVARPDVTTEWNYTMSGWMFCVYLVTLVGVSVLVLRYIEQPARAYIKRRFSEPRRTDTAAQVSVSAAGGAA